MIDDLAFRACPLQRAAWLRSSTEFLNAAVEHESARFLLLHRGRPVVRRDEQRVKQLYWARWADIRDAVLGATQAWGGGHGALLGPEAYGITPRAELAPKAWAAATEGLVPPSLSLAFLGLDQREMADVSAATDLSIPHGAPCFALSLSWAPRWPHLPPQPAPFDSLWEALQDKYEAIDMRVVASTGALERSDLAIVGFARAVLDWHERYRHCPSCGTPQYAVLAGHKHTCATALQAVAEPCAHVSTLCGPSAKSTAPCESTRGLHNYAYPRTDPVVIIGIVHADQNHMLLGRKKAWPHGFYSCIAYVMPLTQGIRRAGRIGRGGGAPGGLRRDRPRCAAARVPHVRMKTHIRSHPWPFPSQLIFGVYAHVPDKAAQIRLGLDDELEDAFFASRDQIRRVLAYVRREGEPVWRNGHKLSYVITTDTACRAVAPWHTSC